ncbi:MAG TPA: sigma factor [Methylophaga sp.]|nr:sigma factor [Methylophaga sp.]
MRHLNQTPTASFDNEQILIQALLVGESTAFEFLIGRYRSPILAIARGIIGKAFADEVVQDVWLSAIKALHEFAGRIGLSTRLVQITVTSRNHVLARKTPPIFK